MPANPEQFAKALKEGLSGIAACEAKKLKAIRDFLGYDLGYSSGSMIEHWGKGKEIPKKQNHVLLLAREIVKRGKKDEQWLKKFLESADYLHTEALCNELFPPRNGALTKPTSTSAATTKPFLAPLEPTHFVGRQKELAEIEACLMDSSSSLFAIVGMSGIGKTLLATKLAHRLRSHFTSGILWAKVASSQPTTTLNVWADVYGVNFTHITDLANKNIAFRHLMADKHALIVLDGVVSISQVESLLPNNPACKLLLTTINRELAEALAAQLWELKPLLPVEEHKLFVALLGQTRVAAEEDAINELCNVLEHLPFAITLIGQRLHSWQDLTIRQMIHRLRTGQSKLAELRTVDRTIRASFETCWEMMDRAQQESFARLAVFANHGFSVEAFQIVTEKDEFEAQALLSTLHNFSLVMRVAQNRYRLHTLLADFAYEKLQSLALVVQAYTQMAHYYLQYAQNHQQHLIELDQEWGQLHRGIRAAFEQQLWSVCISYAQVLTPAWFELARFSEAQQGYDWAWEAALQVGEQEACAFALSHSAKAQIEQAAYAIAQQKLLSALQIYQTLDNRAGLAEVYYLQGRIALEQADFTEARRLLQQSREIKENLDDRIGVAETLYLEADIPYYAGNYVEAHQLGEQALATHRRAQNHVGVIRSLGLLADVAIKSGGDRIVEGEQYCREALTLCELHREQAEKSVILYILAEACRCQNNLHAARGFINESLVLLHSMGDQHMLARALWRSSMIEVDDEQYEDALQNALQSRDILERLGNRWTLTYTLVQLGDVYALLQQTQVANHCWEEAKTMAKALEHPLGEMIAKRLSPASSPN